ncbi:2-oxo acid dehydrogenase subunit E2 [Maribellus maritimus]|uniref:2-oxo acid dehydrogenase subunit E2 n=1 Tax=Maribellus maritimus TaxID=2870838 RepID=UPI001EEC86AE|nr:2-oxo acid dehydrogenase subunit E2 [Maribellus maritimus]MCG6188839.1 2-oxo acid dehydrogenase subunit E2 [Maribellus maritimus]
MKSQFQVRAIPSSRIATFDVFSIGLKKHHVSALIEFDVTDIRRRIKELKKQGERISLNAWMLKAISKALEQHPAAASFLSGRKKLMVFNDVRISLLVEKETEGQKVPLPVVIEKTNRKTAFEITKEINAAKNKPLSPDDIILNKSLKKYEYLYYHLPRFLRLAIWKYILQNPKLAYRKMGNVAVSSVGMIGKLNGWFIHKSIHPISFGLGAIVKKPVVINDEIKIREILNVTVLIDHDVTDGAPMVRFLKKLTEIVESGEIE